MYYWSKSHRGHLPEAAADALANSLLEQDPVSVPCLPCRHVSARGYAKASERRLMLAAAGLYTVRDHFARGEAIRATVRDVDALRHAKLSELHCLRVLRLRDDHVRLMCSRAFPGAKLFKFIIYQIKDHTHGPRASLDTRWSSTNSRTGAPSPNNRLLCAVPRLTPIGVAASRLESGESIL